MKPGQPSLRNEAAEKYHPRTSLKSLMQMIRSTHCHSFLIHPFALGCHMEAAYIGYVTHNKERNQRLDKIFFVKTKRH